jgi:hypothetical protein
MCALPHVLQSLTKFQVPFTAGAARFSVKDNTVIGVSCKAVRSNFTFAVRALLQTTRFFAAHAKHGGKSNEKVNRNPLKKGLH